MKPRISTDSDTDSESVISVSPQIRTSIAIWIRQQSRDKLKSLKENKHYTVLVTSKSKYHSLSVCVKCNFCQTNIQLHHKDKSAINYLISNCIQLDQTCKVVSKLDSYQQSLLGFLSPSSSSSNFSGRSSSSSPCDETTQESTSLHADDLCVHSGDLPESPLSPLQSDKEQVFLNAPLSPANQQ